MSSDDHQPLPPQRERWVLLTIAGIQFSHILDFMIMMPLGPQLTRLFGISDAQFGLLVSAYTLAAGVSGLLASFYVDRFDRKRLLLVLYVLFALATLACGLAPSYAVLLLARVAAGLTGGVLSGMAQTIVADVVPFERRGRAMGVVMSAFSVSTVAGVPAGLWLASVGGWQLPFYAIALVCALLAVAAGLSLPPLRQHLRARRTGERAWSAVAHTLADANHRWALLFSALVMFTGFTVIPYITIALQANAGLGDQDIPLVYLCGGVATLVSARVIGRLTDRLGKVPTFSALAHVVLVPLLAITVLDARAPMALVLLVSTAFFIFMSGRMIPGMAIVTSAAQPALRGTFLAVNGAVQSAAMGLASLVGGHIIARDASGHVVHYWAAAVVGMAAAIASVRVARRLTLHGATPTGRL